MYLYGNEIGDKQIEYLIDVLQNNKTLIELFLENNQIGVESRQLLRKVNKKNPNLELRL